MKFEGLFVLNFPRVLGKTTVRRWIPDNQTVIRNLPVVLENIILGVQNVTKGNGSKQTCGNTKRFKDCARVCVAIMVQ